MINSHDPQNPTARHRGLVIQKVADEVLVYDMDSNRAHCLNRSAALVWESCDGSTSIAEIAQKFDSGGLGKVSEDLIWLAIDQLNENGLLETNIRSGFVKRSRREVLEKIGLASVAALPIIASLVAPKQALGVDSCICTSDSQCFLPGCMGNRCNNLGLCVQTVPSRKQK